MSSNDKSVQDTVINSIPSQSLEEIASLKITKAMIAVSTISKLLSREAFAAVVIVSPKSRQMGAAISRTIIAIVYGRSFLARGGSVPGRLLALRIRKIIIIPKPAPM